MTAAALFVSLLFAPEPTKLHGGFRFTEGPAADTSGEVHFNDIPNQKLYKVDASGKLTVVRTGTNRANGLFFHGNGDLYACEGGAGAVVAYTSDGGRRVIADKYESKRFNAPNDLVIDKGGGVYFTDPFFGRRTDKLPQGVYGVYYVNPKGTVTRLLSGLPKPNGILLSPDKYESKRFNAPNDLVIDKGGGVYFTDPFFGRRTDKLPQGVYGVYYVNPQGTVTRLLSGLPKPNGILLSPDEKTLYVVCSGQADIMAYRVEKPGAIDKGRRFFSLKQPEGKTNTGGDGLTVDEKGNLYVTSRLGIQVISSAGKLVRILEFPEKPANCAFGGKDRKTLYVTARTSVYTMRLDARGHVFPAGRAE